MERRGGTGACPLHLLQCRSACLCRCLCCLPRGRLHLFTAQEPTCCSTHPAGAPKEGQETYGGVYQPTSGEQGAAEAAGYSYAATRE